MERQMNNSSNNGVFTLLKCRMLRIGSYTAVPVTDPVELSTEGIRISVPHPNSEPHDAAGTKVVINVDRQSLVSVLAHFGNGYSIPVLFLYAKLSVGIEVRQLLGMAKGKEPYFDPAADEETHKRIILLTENKIPDDTKVLIRQIFQGPPKDIFVELQEMEAIAILKKADMNDVIMDHYMHCPCDGMLVTLLKCPTVQVGSYRAEPLDPVLLCAEGIRIRLPIPGSSPPKLKKVTIEVDRESLVFMLSHFGNSIPALFLYTKLSIASEVRSLLRMTEGKEPYFDPAADEEITHKRIVLLPEKIPDDAKVLIQQIFQGSPKDSTLHELEEREAHKILEKCLVI